MTTATHTDQQREFLAGKLADAIAGQPGWERLAERLRALDGTGQSLIVAQYEEDLDALLERGEDFSGRPVRKRRGQPCSCHANSARLWEQDRSLQLVTGWAMSSDLVWRQHSWVVAANGTVGETTTTRTHYFGVALTDSEAVMFAFANS